MVQRATSVVQVWWAVRWVPRWRFAPDDARDVWAFGRGLTGSNVLNYWVASADRVLLGRLVSVTDLGFYNRATNLMQLPLQQTTRTLSTVFFPALATMSTDLPRLTNAWLRLVRAAWIVGLPAGVGLLLISRDAVPVLYGPGWGPVVPILMVLSAGVPFLILGMTTGPAYQALGRTGLQFRVGLVSSALAVVGLVIGVRWGVIGVAVAVAVRALVQLLLS
ncbi:MAG TPA: oligosaccharide flippase family protein, partial [Actinotalea sp.]|nr:oligosaccharide flippase family protein [Actinotalea sp.]